MKKDKAAEIAKQLLILCFGEVNEKGRMISQWQKAASILF